MGTYSDIAGKIVYESASKRQKTLDLLEEKGYEDVPIVTDTEEFDGEMKPILRIQRWTYRNLGRNLDDFYQHAERYTVLCWTWDHDHILIVTEDMAVNKSIRDWLQAHDELGPPPKERDDPPDGLDRLGWEQITKNEFFSTSTYEEYTDLNHR
jgi:hypothetical protein